MFYLYVNTYSNNSLDFLKGVKGFDLGGNTTFRPKAKKSLFP